MKVTKLDIPEVLLLEPRLFSDNRGFFMESFNSTKFCEAVGREIKFLQDNQSHSKQAVLRGLHYQVKRPQGKLVRVTVGEVYDVAVDLREGSLTFGKWVGEYLSAENNRQLWIPEGFAHGFLVISEAAQFHYKVTDYWMPEHERCIVHSDDDLGIEWPSIKDRYSMDMPFMVSGKDRDGSSFVNAEKF